MNFHAPCHIFVLQSFNLVCKFMGNIYQLGPFSRLGNCAWLQVDELVQSEMRINFC